MMSFLRKVGLVMVLIVMGIAAAWWIWCVPVSGIAADVNDGPCTVIGRVIQRAPHAYAIEDPSGVAWILADEPLRPGTVVIVQGGAEGSDHFRETWRLAVGH
ncbi:MAG: hypothetical protein QGI75_07490 [Phycisphaerales bacterium]|jgi:hypothetical protein|nr:hypothetical protein [Phycisphaerales bacterium]